jgi:hypothetical protein
VVRRIGLEELIDGLHPEFGTEVDGDEFMGDGMFDARGIGSEEAHDIDVRELAMDLANQGIG